MTVRWDDLPERLKGRVQERPPRQVRLPLERPTHDVWRCATCGETFRAQAKAERHANQPGHARLECIL